ncbi:MAG: hypothetical protein DWQ01_21135 [Planctomycetota bacterium]|nr:MAG: hypothetical protein DWQ01_21135 [Planctomycetota bacterium]
MKLWTHPITFGLLALTLPCFAIAGEETEFPQEPAVAKAATPPATSEFATVEALVQALYQAVSFPAGTEPNWQRLKSMMGPKAIFVQPPRGGSKPMTLSVDEFIQLFKDDIERSPMKTSGFHEKVGRVEISRFGSLAHAMVVFEVRFDPKAEQPLGRGVDSLQLYRYDGRWWIASITTEYERPGKPIPATFHQQEGKKP